MFFRKKYIYTISIVSGELKVVEEKVISEDSEYYYIKDNHFETKPCPKKYENVFNWTTDKKKFAEMKNKFVMGYLSTCKEKYIKSKEDYKKAIDSAKALGYDLNNEFSLDE